MRQRNFTRPTARLLLCVLLLNFALLLAACGGASGASAAAATMHLKKTEGTVSVADGEGNDVAPAENLGLYSGYTVATEAESYAWIDLDAVKLAKMDAGSAVEIVRDGKQLTVNVQSGRLFFNVTEPLADDETMEIAASSMLVGIRGTCGWVAQDRVGLLEGTVTVTAGEQSVTVNAGEMAVLTQNGTLEVKPLSAVSIPTFVRTEVAQNEKLSAEVLEATGIDFSKEEPPVPHDVEAVIAKSLDEVLYSEWLDFDRNGAPELLVLGLQSYKRNSDTQVHSRVVAYIFAEDARTYSRSDSGSDRSDAYLQDLRGIDPEWNDEISWALVEADGRRFIEVDRIHTDGDPAHPVTVEEVWYYGFDAEGNWFGETISGYEEERNGGARYSLTYTGEEYLEFVFAGELAVGEFAATRAKYTLLKPLLYCPDGVTVTVTAP